MISLIKKSSAAAMLLIFNLSPLSAAENRTQPLNIDLMHSPVYGKIEAGTEFPLSRLPADMKGKIPKKLYDLSLDTAGLYTAFETDANRLEIRYKLKKALGMPHMHNSAVSGMDLYIFRNGRWEFLKNSKPSSKAATWKITDLAQGTQRYLLLYPLYNQPLKLSLKRPAGSNLQFTNPFKEGEVLPVIVYGTSITQGCSASRAGTTTTSRLRLKLNAPVVNMGFSGSALMEEEMARYLARFEAKVLILDCLWNMDGRFSPQEIEMRTMRLVNIYREAHPEVPILLCGQSRFDNITPTEAEKGMVSAIEKLKAAGISGLHYLPGSKLIGNDTEGTVDGVHPNDLGMERMFHAYAGILDQILTNE